MGMVLVLLARAGDILVQQKKQLLSMIIIAVKCGMKMEEVTVIILVMFGVTLILPSVKSIQRVLAVIHVRGIVRINKTLIRFQGDNL